jgi:hypothetical protein
VMKLGRRLNRPASPIRPLFGVVVRDLEIGVIDIASVDSAGAFFVGGWVPILKSKSK